MTSQEWTRRSAERILKTVQKAERIRIRDLQRATHYNRGPGDAVDLWFEALYSLEDEKLIVIERKRLHEIEGEDELGFAPQWVMSQVGATLARMGAYGGVTSGVTTTVTSDYP